MLAALAGVRRFDKLAESTSKQGNCMNTPGKIDPPLSASLYSCYTGKEGISILTDVCEIPALEMFPDPRLHVDPISRVHTGSVDNQLFQYVVNMIDPIFEANKTFFSLKTVTD